MGPYDSTLPSAQDDEERQSPDLTAAMGRQATAETNFFKSLAGGEDEPRASLTGGRINPALALLPMLAQMQQAQTPFAQGANAFLNGFYGAQGMRNPNPAPVLPNAMQMFQVIHTLYKDQETARQQAAILELKKDSAARLQAQADDIAQARATAQANKEGDASIAFYKMFKDHPDENVRLAASQAAINGYNKKGVPTPDALLQGIASKQFTDKDVNDSLQMIANGISPEFVAAIKGWSPQQIEELKGPGALLGEDTRVARATKAIELKDKEMKYIKEQFPELTGDGARFFVQQMRNVGKTYEDLKTMPQDQVQNLADQARLAQNAETIAMKTKEAAITLANQKVMAGVNLEKAKELERFKWANEPAAISGKILLNANGQAPTVQQMQQPARVLSLPQNGGFFVATPEEAKHVNNVQQLKTMMKDVNDAMDRANDLGLFASRQGMYGVPIVGPLLESITSRPDVQRRTTTSMEKMEALTVLQQKKANMVSFARAQNDLGRTLAATLPDMEAISPENGYAGGKKVLADMEREMKADLANSRTPGAWDAKPNIIPPTMSGGDSRQPITKDAALNQVNRELNRAAAAGVRGAELEALRRKIEEDQRQKYRIVGM